MSVFYGSSYNLARGDLIQIQIRATNDYGDGLYSAINTVGALVETVPSQVSPAPSMNSGTNNTYIDVSWTAVTGNNTGSTVENLTITYDFRGRLKGASSWTDLSLETSQTSYQTTDSDGLTITEGNEYEFYVVAKNKYGDSIDSDIGTIKASTLPDVVPDVTTANNSIYVQVAFGTTPGRGEDIIDYDILILQSSSEGGQYISETTN